MKQGVPAVGSDLCGAVCQTEEAVCCVAEDCCREISEERQTEIRREITRIYGQSLRRKRQKPLEGGESSGLRRDGHFPGNRNDPKSIIPDTKP